MDFVFGYSLPLGSVVSTAKGGVRKVELPFSSPIRDLLVQDLTVKVRTCALLVQDLTVKVARALLPPALKPYGL